MGHIYSPRHYYRRVKVFLKEFGNSKVDTPIDFQRFLAFFRSGIRLGILGKERFPLLVFNDLDTGAQTQAASPGRHPCHIRPSLPEDMRDTYLLSRVANYPLKPADICLEQIRNYYEWLFQNL